jgi:hypothetical protein
VVERILALRDEPPDHLRRVPGPRTLLAFLHRDPEALALALPLPRSSRTVWQVLRRSGRSEADLPRFHQPLELPAPLEEIQADCTDIGTVPPDLFGKRQHAVEALLFEDVGSRHVVYAEISSDFHAETALAAVVACLRRTGLIGKLTGLPRSKRGGRAQRMGLPQRADSLASSVSGCSPTCAPRGGRTATF